MKTIITSFFICLSFVVCGQINLVPNPSFEIMDSCPSIYLLINGAPPWFQPNYPQIPSATSTDLFHPCSSNQNLQAPTNAAGYQNARTGLAYAGFALFTSLLQNNNREYAEVELDSNLIDQSDYCVSINVSVSGLWACYGSSAIGIYFSEDTCQYFSNSYFTLPVVPQLVNDSNNIITDTVNWTQLKWIYKPQGGEKFITIGNFWNAGYVSQNSTPIGNCSSPAAYFYMDDVSVVKLPKLEAGRDTAIIVSEEAALNGSITETWPGMQFEWLPHTGLDNPYSLTPTASPTVTTTYTLTVSCATCNVPCLTDLRDTATITVNEVPPPPAPLFNIPTLIGEQPFFITGLQAGSRLTIYNLLGQLLFETADYQNNLWPVVVWDEGMYMYELVQPDGTRITGKWCLVK
jgi:hypothetical protein